MLLDCIVHTGIASTYVHICTHVQVYVCEIHRGITIPRRESAVDRLCWPRLKNMAQASIWTLEKMKARA